MLNDSVTSVIVSNDTILNCSLYNSSTLCYDHGEMEYDYDAMVLVATEMSQSRRFDEPMETIILTFYTILIIFGATGNGLVCYVVTRNAHMRTPRNIFIINLSISDLTLCLFTQPLNLYRLLHHYWMLGGFMCKFVAMCQGTNIFVSTISITAIALDRFQVIVYPTKDSMKKIGAAAALVSIWIISFFMASPLLIFNVFKVDQPAENVPVYFYRCVEDITLIEEKGAYSIASMVVQYILPIAIVVVAHARICHKLKYRMVHQNTNSAPNTGRSPFQKRKNQRQERRKRRTNILLAMIASVFAISWFPLNILNILLDVSNGKLKALEENVSVAFVICHILVLSSACTNPLLYGWLNENFRNEFIKVLCCKCCFKFKTCLHRCCARREGTEVPTIIFTRETNGDTAQADKEGYSVTGTAINSVSEFRSQVSL